jgi:Tol biopolymer transport system component
MALKTCLQKLCKYLPTSVESQVACALDEQQEAGIPKQFAPEVPAPEEFDWGTAAADGAEVTCSACGSPNVITIEWRGPTSTLTWSANGKWLIAIDHPSKEAQPASLYAYVLETGKRHRLIPASLRSDVDACPSMSPGGRNLAFISVRAVGAVGELYALAVSRDLAPLGEPNQLTFERRFSTSPVWTPDGRAILFSSGDVTGDRELWGIGVSKGVASSKPGRLAPLEGGYSIMR